MATHLHLQQAARRVSCASTPQRIILRSASDIRRYFENSERNYYFISASNFNMIRMHGWVRGWHNINMIDCFDGESPAVTVIKDDHSRIFRGMEDVNHYLIDQPLVKALVSANAAIRDIRLQRTDPQTTLKDQALFLFFDESLEEKCRSMGLEVALPAQALVREVDSKIVTTRIGDEAGVASVPNVLTPVRSWEHLQRVAHDFGLGDRWVVQSAFGDSGKTTYFIDCEDDYQRVSYAIESQAMVKVMRRIRCVGAAIEACATRWGTVVGPLLTEIIGQSSLTPYPGGWCGNENYDAAFTPDQRQQVQQKAKAMGDALYRRGYRGTFELDFLFDMDSDQIYLGELNARVTGVTALTNTSDFSEQNLPLFLFHLLEFDDAVDLQIDLDAFNAHLLIQGSAGISSQLIVKHVDSSLKVITQAPPSGVYRLDCEGRLQLCKKSSSRRAALSEDEAFVLRIQAAGDYAYLGGDLAIAFLNCTVRESDGRLSASGHQWTEALQASFVRRALTPEEVESVALLHNPANVKSAGDA